MYNNRLLFDFLQYLFNPINNFSKEYIAERIAGVIIKYSDAYKDIKEKMDYETYLKEYNKITNLILIFLILLKIAILKNLWMNHYLR